MEAKDWYAKRINKQVDELDDYDAFVAKVANEYYEYKQEPQEKPKRYKCLLCGRDKFTQKQAHICENGYRKRGIKWEEIY